MTEEEAKMIPIRRLWAAVLERGVLDYRKAIFDHDESRQRTIETEIKFMGYGAYLPQLEENTRRFRRIIDREIRNDPRRRRRYIDCPACGSEKRCEIIRRKTAFSAICYSCGIRYHFPCWRLKEEE